MSYYSYHKKVVLEVKDKILFLAVYSDSSVTTTNYAYNGRRYEYHPRHWCHITFDGETLLVDKETFKKQVQDAINSEFECLNDYYKRYGDSEKPSFDSQCYAGTVYPSGRKVKDMRSFHSIQRAIDANEWLSQPFHAFWIKISVFSWETYQNRDYQEFYIQTADDLLNADEAYRRLSASRQAREEMSLSIRGLSTDKRFK